MVLLEVQDEWLDFLTDICRVQKYLVEKFRVAGQHSPIDNLFNLILLLKNFAWLVIVIPLINPFMLISVKKIFIFLEL